MSQPKAWTPEYTARLGMIARGEWCPHLSTLDLFTYGNEVGVTLCMKCGQHIGNVTLPEPDDD